MTIKVLMPALSPTMKSGNLVNWCKKEGDTIEAGEVIAEIDTDKAMMEVEAVEEGILGKIIVPAGTNGVKVNDLIAVLLEEGEGEEDLQKVLQSLEMNAKDVGQNQNRESDLLKDSVPKSTPGTVHLQKNNNRSNDGGDGAAALESPTNNKINNGGTERQGRSFDERQIQGLDQYNNERIFISPLARSIARNQAIDIELLRNQGSGPRGRITKRDVLSFLEKKGNSYGGFGQGAITDGNFVRLEGKDLILPLSGMRAVIAQRLTHSKQNIPHFYLSMDINVEELLKIRSQINAAGVKRGFKISVNDMIIKASAMALKAHPVVNASFIEEDQSILQFANVDISVAVAIEGGLITPIVRNADCKSLMQISSEVKVLRKKANEGVLKAEEFQGGGFAISNLGMYGITDFKAIINPPQAAILAVGATTQQPIVKGGMVQVADIMKVNLSCDHRIVDGDVAAHFLQSLREFLESPAQLLL